MPIVFSRSVRSLEADSYRGSGIALGIAAVMAAAWAGWFFFAKVAVIEVAETARLEAAQSAHGVEAPVAGKILVSQMALGREVKEGELLVELDAEPLRLALAEARAQETAFAPQIAALREELTAGERALQDNRRTSGIRVDETGARYREATSAASLSAAEAKRAERLRAEGLLSEGDAQRAASDREQKRAAAEALRIAMKRIGSEQTSGETDRHAALAHLRRELALLEGQRDTSTALLKRLESDIERRLIRAPIAGHLGEVAPLRPGAVVKEGEKLADVIPAGSTRIVAEYLPASAVGRIRPGQNAHMRADGFAWTQYGMLTATVRGVASEPRSGRMRVELDVREPSASMIPMQHGLPGTLEIEVERVSPAVLVLRSAGSKLAAPAGGTETGTGSGNPSTTEAPMDRP